MVPRPEWPWLLEVDSSSGMVVAWLAGERDGAVINARRSASTRRVHASLASACEAYQIDPNCDLCLRFQREIVSGTSSATHTPSSPSPRRGD
ncbi:MAG: hypothetical protein Q8Q09_23425 [Deltaproteobacteria bacterium]|nr:hypothetical protein [Deltaproteobacteria bacterium]